MFLDKDRTIDNVQKHNICTYKIVYICQLLEKKWEYSEMVHQLFIDFKEAYNSVRREVLCSVLIEFGEPMNLVRQQQPAR
jgi:hypothetical protein